MTVLQFPDRRTPGPHDAAACACGCEWFELRTPGATDDPDAGTVRINAGGSVLTYIGVPHCAECGQARMP